VALIQCDIVSAESEIFSGEIEMLVATGKGGDLGIAHGHAALLSQLNPGPIRIIKENGEEELYYVGGGMLEVQPNVVTVLADTAVRADDVDEAAALAAQESARQALLDQSSEIDYTAAAAALAEAAARLRTVQQIRKKLGN